MKLRESVLPASPAAIPVTISGGRTIRALPLSPAVMSALTRKTAEAFGVAPLTRAEADRLKAEAQEKGSMPESGEQSTQAWIANIVCVFGLALESDTVEFETAPLEGVRRLEPPAILAYYEAIQDELDSRLGTAQFRFYDAVLVWIAISKAQSATVEAAKNG